MIRVLGIAGSLRTGSFNRALLDAAAGIAPAGMVIELADIALPLFDEDLERAGDPPAVRALRERVRAADGLLIATPEYNRSVPGGLKNAIDWLSRDAPDAVLAGKPVAVIGATPGAWGTRIAKSHLREILTAVEARVLPGPNLFVRHASAAFEPSVLASLAGVLAAFAAQLAPSSSAR